MPYARKSIAKKTRSRRRSPQLNSKIARIAKTVALRQQETKHAAQSYANRELYHNNAYNITPNLINIQQGVQDHAHRIGDEVTLRGIKLYMKFEDKWDRPNTNFRVVVAKCRQGVAGNLSLPIKVITGNASFDPVDMEQLMKVYINRTYRFGDKNTFIDTTGGAQTANNPRTTHFRKLWIPLNNVKYKFVNQNTSQGTAYNIAMWVAAYDASTELTTDNIGSIQVIGEVFFKDG
jgi:hypothetical protein